ncbi:MAG: hypothetical protein AAFX40_12615 [Cyanobacteria bacterium J06639_1]
MSRHSIGAIAIQPPNLKTLSESETRAFSANDKIEKFQPGACR